MIFPMGVQSVMQLPKISYPKLKPFSIADTVAGER